MSKTRMVHQGIAYHSVGGAAKILKTSAAEIKKLMGDGTLEWCNLRTNGRLVVTEASLIKLRLSRLSAKKAAARVQD